MAAISSTVAAIGKKLLASAISEPEKALKAVGIVLTTTILIITILISLPTVLIVSLPTILLNYSGKLFEGRQLEIIQTYQNMPADAMKIYKEWYDNEIEKYSDCDEMETVFKFNLTWQDLMAIDAILLNQDFTHVSKSKLLELVKKFVYTESYSYTYEKEVVDTTSYTDDEGNSHDEESRYTVTVKVGVVKVHTKEFSQVVNEMGFDPFEKGIAQNIYDMIASVDIEGELNIYDEDSKIPLTPEDFEAGSANIVYFNQGDPRWASASYGNSSIKAGGCGPTSLAMVIASLTGREDINPKVIADWSVANGHRAEGAGSYWTLMTQGGKSFGLTVDPISRQDPKDVVEALSEGKPVIVSMGSDHFTNGGHFIVLTGITEDGKITVNDPASYERTQKEWDLDVIMNESSKNGGVNGSPFWVFSKETK